MTKSSDDSGEREALDQGLLEIWNKSRSTVLERVTAIEGAVTELERGTLDDATRADAERAAHKLAGVAGTFGFWEASELAREVEHALAVDAVLTPDIIVRLREIAVTLRAQL